MHRSKQAASNDATQMTLLLMALDVVRDTSKRSEIVSLLAKLLLDAASARVRVANDAP
jgi:hypothetical protein